MQNIPEQTQTPTEQIPADLQKLVLALSTLPEQHAVQLAPLVDSVVESTKRRRRIDMKYLMFDLEATRRERDEYRCKLDEQES